MDDSPQNDGMQQKPAEENSSYQQYLDPASGPKRARNKMIILIAAGAAVFLIIVLVIVILVTRGDKPDQSPQSSQSVAACTDETCFNDHFAQCLPATYTYDEAQASIKYSITGNGEIGCNVSMEYLKSQYSPEEAGKSMTCDFDNTVDFQTAAQNVFHFPNDYACQGDLVGLFQASSDTSGSTN